MSSTPRKHTCNARTTLGQAIPRRNVANGSRIKRRKSFSDERHHDGRAPDDRDANRSDKGHDRFQSYNRKGDHYRPNGSRLVYDRDGHRYDKTRTDNHRMTNDDHYIEFNEIFFLSSPEQTGDSSPVAIEDFANSAHLVDSVFGKDGKDGRQRLSGRNKSRN